MAVKSNFSEVQLALILDNKHEYTEHICDNLSEVLVKVFQDIYEKAYKSPLGKNKGALEAFQTECEGVVSWNAEMVSQLFKRVKNPSFSKLLKMVFMTYIKSILAQHGLRLEGRLHVRIPGAEHFVHKCAIEMARNIWKRPYLYYHKVRSLERQRNLHECELIARKAIRIVLRQSIPMEQILQEIEIANIGEVESEPTITDSETESQSSIAEEESEMEIKVESTTESEEEIQEQEPEDEIEDEDSQEDEPVKTEYHEVRVQEETEDVEEPIKEEVEETEDVEEPIKEEVEESKTESGSESESDIDGSNPSTQEKTESEEDVIRGHSEDERTVVWTPSNVNETIEVEKNETPTNEEKPIPQTTVELKTTLMGTRHLINPKRIKFVSSGKKDSFF